MFTPWECHSQPLWKMKFNFWIFVLCLSLLIIFVNDAGGQGKEIQSLLLSHEDVNSGLPSPSDLSENLKDSAGDNDILRVKTNEFFPKKLENSFQKHRWKFNFKDFNFTPALHNNQTSSLTSLSLPILSSSSSENTTTLPKSTGISNISPFFEDENYEAEHNSGSEDEDYEDDDPEILKLMNSATVPDVPRIVEVNVKHRRRFDNITQNDRLGPELINTTLLKEIQAEDTIKQKERKNNNEVAADNRDNSENTKNDGDNIELLKLNQNHSSGSGRSSSQHDKQIYKFHSENVNFTKENDDEEGPNMIRIIPQLVNVTTENVYVSVESDESGGENFSHNNKNDKTTSLNYNHGKHGEFSRIHEFPSISTVEPSLITVNASGIFPEPNLSSIWDKHTANKESALRKHQKNSSSQQKNSNKQNEEDQILTNDSGSSSSGEDTDLSSEDGDDDDDGGGSKTLMMQRRPRRSVVHLYDMVVCATGCNPLIYKGYGCFCGFMGSGLTVDGIDKCCYKHDWCYHHAKCPPLLTYFVPYYWTCNAGHPRCVSDFRGWKGICGAHLCECDRQFAECLRKYPCPRSRAMCMTSPWRFWQNIVMPSPHYR